MRNGCWRCFGTGPRRSRFQTSNRIGDLLDSWLAICEGYRSDGVDMQYQKYEAPPRKPLLRGMLDQDFESPHHRKFRAVWSLRDVEPQVNLFLKNLSGGAPGSGG